MREAEELGATEAGSTAADVTKGRVPNLHFGLVGRLCLSNTADL